MNMKERVICEFEMDLRNLFVSVLILSMITKFLPMPVLKTGVKNDLSHSFWSEIGSGFGEPGGTPPTRIYRSTPRVVSVRALFLGNFFMPSTQRYLNGQI